jgi:sugar phosphate permease
MIISIWSIIYGIGKFLNGYFSDRSNARYFMSLGLLGSALTSLAMGWGSGIYFFGGIWAFNAWFQSMGWPPVSRLLTHWFGPKELGTKWGITNLSHQIGGAIIAVLAGYLIEHYGWRSAFFVPSIIALGAAFLLFNRLRDTPQSLGLPSIEEHLGLVKTQQHVDEENLPNKEILKRIFCNKLLWYVCFGNMFLYIVRMGVFNWAPTFLKELKGASLASSGWQVAAFEIAGMIGGIAAGWISDKLFSGRRGPVSFLYMVALIFCLVYFWLVPAGYDGLNALAMTAVGFLVYGPQVLVGVAAADFASKKAVGMAVGLTGSFGYLGAAISGYCIGKIADQYGWDGGFIFFIVSAILGAGCFMLTWRHRAKVLENA